MNDSRSMGHHKVNISTTGLYNCIKACSIYTAHECLREGETVHIKCEDTGRSFLHLVVLEAQPMNEINYVPFVYMLSNNGICLDDKDTDGSTALQLSIKGNLSQIMVALLKCGAIADENDEELISKRAGYFVAEYRSNFRKFSPGLWETVADNNRFRVNKLVKSWCRVNISRDKKSLIEYAKESEADDGIVDLLLKHEASIEFAHATIAGDEERMRVLLCNGSVDLGTRDLSHRENFFGPYIPLGLKEAAIKYGHDHVLRVISGHTGTSAPEDNRGNTNSVICTIL